VIHAVGTILRGTKDAEIHDIDQPYSNGTCFCNSQDAATASVVGTSPAQARTTSRGSPWSLLAQSQIEAPREQCLSAMSKSSH
jgi:hypothetical protein